MAQRAAVRYSDPSQFPLSDMQRYIADELVEDYKEGLLERRDFLRRLALVMGGAALAASFAAVSGCGSAPGNAPASSGGSSSATGAAGGSGAASSAVGAGSSAAGAAGATAGAVGPTAAAASGAGAAGATTATGVTVAETDPAIEARMIEFGVPDAQKGGQVKLMAYLAKPRGDGPFPGLVVIHENRGLVEHIKDVARRAAKAGYAAIAPDLAAREGGTDKFTDTADVTGLLGRTPPDQLVADLQSNFAHLKSQPFVRGDRIGAVGFCFGGGMAWRLATRQRDLRAAAPFYGPAPPLDDVKNIQAAVLAIYAGKDQRINAGIPQLDEALKAGGKSYEIKVFADVDHAFHNDTNAARYNAAAAREAWDLVMAFFDKHLKS